MKQPASPTFFLISATIFVYLISPVFVAKTLISIPTTNTHRVEAVFCIFYAPAIALHKHFPPYKWFLDKQVEWLGL